ncbi:hypothetical protein [Paenisporosarcina cavernae]|uniref:Uncharacterized protein n=1 Tax=Paenisporosarcina cavernae TaxID=2320858 RepID=A0A385YV00_9BACL|nr:hypothetical protein [Paenisporosarcina cavernae]AYC30374.1 hypothetical protein D3873_11215 [Paenisporosarcina cavernae]
MAKRVKDFDDYIFHAYFHLNEAQQYILAQGITMKDFAENTKPLSNLLFLKPAYEESSYNMHTQLEFITSEDMEDFLEELEDHPIELCWIDFEEEKKLAQLTPPEQAELLYLGHKKEALRSPFYFQLNNQFVYLSNEEEKKVKVYYRDSKAIELFIQSLFQREMAKVGKPLFWKRKQQKAQFTISPEQMREIKEFAREGAFFSIYRVEKPQVHFTLEIRTLSEFVYVNEIWDDLENFVQSEADQTIAFST